MIADGKCHERQAAGKENHEREKTHSISAPYANRDQATHDGWTSYHGYHARNYFTTNKHFGTMAEFDELQQELTDAGIKLVIDFVTNHSSDSRYDGKIYEPDRNSAGEFVFDSAGEPVDYNNDGTTENLVADPNNDTNGWFHHLGDRGTDNSTFATASKSWPISLTIPKKMLP